MVEKREDVTIRGGHQRGLFPLKIDEALLGKFSSSWAGLLE
jgi:hypothetical protein